MATRKLEELHEKLKQDVEDFLTDTEEARRLSERDRDYKDHKQWTQEEASKIESRGQAAITVNRVKPKVEGLKGLLIQRKTDPKAWPRTPKHEKAAEVITDGLRYIADNNDFDKVKLENAENVFVEGYGAIITEVVRKGNELEIINTSIPWDRYYFDTHSRRLDFTDKRWDGIIIWMDAEDVQQTFKLTNKQMESVLDDSNMLDGGEETFDDRPQWVDRDENRVRICQHFFIDKGVWNMCYFTHSMFLEDPVPSPYLDEYGEPINPIESVAANIDRDNNRFGEVRYWIDLQDEINHRRSKYLHLLSVRQTMGRKGAIADIPALKRESAKADGHLEYEGEKGDFEFIKTNDMADAQFTLLQDAKGELDAIGFNAQLSGERQGDLSGTAITNLQQAATNELSSLYAGLTDLERRVYRQDWMRMKQFWNEEKWLRITDDKSKLRWVGLNQKIKLIDLMTEQAEDESVDLEFRTEIAGRLQQMMQNQDPRLQQIVETRNDVAELDVDIIIETSYDSINIQREQFELLGKIAQTRPDVPFTEVLKLSELRGKDKIIQSLEASAQAQQEAQQKQQQILDQTVQVENLKTESEARLNARKGETESAKAHKSHSDAELTELQTELLLDQPPENSGVVI
jgi:hypothetical protein